MVLSLQSGGFAIIVLFVAMMMTSCQNTYDDRNPIVVVDSSCARSVSRLEQEVDELKAAVSLLVTVQLRKFVSDDDDAIFRPVTYPDGSTVCAVDTPSVVLSASQEIPGVPENVLGVTRCAVLCKARRDCTSFNYRQSSRVSMEGGQCELYMFTPTRCSANRNNNCQHYQLSEGTRGSCRPFDDFDYIPGSQTYYKLLYEKMSWGDATRRCLELSPFAHLVVIDSLDEYHQIQSYLRAVPDNACRNDFWQGFWTAKKRLNVSATSKEACLASPLVWAKDNTTSGLLPEQSWESAMWWIRQPDCGQVDAGMFEECVHFIRSRTTPNLNWTLNDLYCWLPTCVLCELEVN